LENRNARNSSFLSFSALQQLLSFSSIVQQFIQFLFARAIISITKIPQ